MANLELLIEEGYIKLENYFVDGTKIGTNTKAHKVVWAKKTRHYKERLQEQIQVMLDEIEQVSEKENKEYGYGSEENYAWLEKKQLKNFLKYNTFHKEQHPPRKPELVEKARFLSTHFPYDPAKDEFTCPAGHPMTYLETKPYKTTAGNLSERRFYECTQCAVCPLKSKCTQAKGNRHIQVSFELQRYRQQARENLLSEQGIASLALPARASVCKKRSTEPETVFGDIKHNRGFRRFSLRGL
jgi:hypothetical protein